MDFLKKHYEKIVLAAALLVLIVSAIMLALKAGAVSAEIQEAPRRSKPKSNAVKPTDVGPYTNAIASLKDPPLWTIDPSSIFPPSHNVKQEPKPDDVRLPDKGPPVALVRAGHRPFKLRFDAYSGKGENFQLNFQFRLRTFFIPSVGMEVGDQFEKTGYILTKFENKTCLTEVPGVGKRETDCSEVTLQREGEKTVVLVLGKAKEEEEPFALLLCGKSRQQIEVRRGLDFECDDIKYKVVDIDSNQVIILEKQTGQRHTIK